MTPFDRARQVIARGIASRVFPGAVAEVGSSAGPLWCEPAGALTFGGDARAVAPDTVYDLASLTKPIATTSLVMELTRTGAIALEELLPGVFPDWRGDDRASVSVRDLLEHASGLPARLVDAPPFSRREFEHDICVIPLEYLPRTRSIYSDLGFILLGFAIADRSGLPIDRLFAQLVERVAGSGEPTLSFAGNPDAAPTEPMAEDLRRGRMFAGEVHDNYAAALGGVAGHAGLFGTAGGVGTFARTVLRAARGDRTAPPPFTPELVARFTARSVVPGSSRALGWDTMLPTSSCGTKMSRTAFGHVGFTGTSLWIDPARDRYFVLLANRVCGGGTLDEMRDVRRAFHDALGDA